MENKLKEVLQEKKLSQRRLSMMAGIATQDINQVINGKKTCFPAWRKRIAKALNIDEAVLFPEYRAKGVE